MSFDLRAAIDLLTDVGRHSSNEHDVCMLLTNAIAVRVKEMHPVVDVLTQVSHVRAGWVLLEFRPAGDLDELVASLVLAEKFAPQLEAVALDVDPHRCSSQVQRGSDPSQQKAPEI